MGVEIRVPSLGESVAEATVARWFKRIGDTVTEDEPIVELETDKVTLEFNAPASGTLAEILVEEGGDVEVGALLGSIDQDGGEAKAGGAKAGEARKEAAPDRGDGPLSPAVRKLIDEHGLDPASIMPTGPKGNITKGDVLAALEAGVAEQAEPEEEANGVPAPAAPEAAAPEPEPEPEPKAPLRAAAPAQPPTQARPAEPVPAARREPAQAPAPRPASGPREERVKMTRLRRRIAERLKEAQNKAAILTTYNEADMSAVLALRTRYRDSFQQKHGVRLGFMSFFVKASINALQAFPIVNAEIDGDEIVYHGR